MIDPAAYETTSRPPACGETFAGGLRLVDVVHSFLEQSGPHMKVMSLSDRVAHLVVPLCSYVLFAPNPSETQLGDEIKAMMKKLGDGGGVFVLLGGGEELFKIARRALPTFSTKSVRLIHYQEDRKVRMKPGSLLNRRPAPVRWIAAAEPGMGRLDDPRIVQGVLESSEQSALSQEVESRLSEVTPWATYGALALIALTYCLQLLWGESAALRMGALSPQLVKQGELYRILSAGFLHGGFVHAAANSFVLFILGTQIERVLGTARFVLLYVVSLVGGSLLSMMFLGDGISVGASGAIWGLLVAQACLAFGRPKILPSVVAKTMQTAAMYNLMINVFVSFRENVDWAAHVGGGLAGGLLLISGAGSIGLNEKRFLSSAEPSPTPAGYRAVAGAGALLMLAGVATAQIQGRPWEMNQPLTYREVRVQQAAASVNVPSELEAKIQKADGEGNWALSFGDVQKEVALADISFFTQAGIEASEAETTLKEDVLPQMQLPEKAQQLEGFHVSSVNQVPAVSGRFSFKNGAIQEIWVLVIEGAIVRLDLYCIDPKSPRCARAEDVLAPLTRN